MKGRSDDSHSPPPTLAFDTEARPKAWVQGCVQFCDDVAIGGDLDWEFAFFSHSGRRTGRNGRIDMATKRRKRGKICRCCIPMPPESMWAPVNYSSKFPRIAIQNQCAVTRHLPEISTNLPIGSRAAVFARWQWSPPSFTGFRCTRSCRPAAWSFPGQCKLPQERSRQKERRLRLLMDSISPLRGPAEGGLLRPYN
jgi:hypothetical protein